jgi:tetratricopeptide (TPR) repeat protein
MRRSFILATALIGGGFLAPLPAMAQKVLNLQALQRAWQVCAAPRTAADERFAACNTIIASKGIQDEMRARALIGRGFARIMQGDRAGAIMDFDESIRLFPTATAHSYRGSLRISREEFDAAVTDYDRAIALEPNNVEYHGMRGYAHAQRKDYARAVADHTKVIELSPKPLAGNYMLRAIDYDSAGEKDKAIADYQKVLELDPDNNTARRFLAGLGGTPLGSAQLPPGLCSGVADTTSHQDRIKGCTEVIDSGQYTGWTLKTAYCNRAYALTEIGEYDQVIADSNALLKVDPNASCAFQNRGRAWYYKKDLDQAIADYDQAIKIEPKFVEAIASRGTAYHDRMEFDRAIADYDLALRIEPDAEDVRKWRENTLSMKRAWGDAVADMARDIERKPENAERFRQRGDLYAMRGNLDRAIADFTAAAELVPNESSHLHARAKMYDLKGEAKLAEADRAEADKRQFNRFRALLEQPRETTP